MRKTTSGFTIVEVLVIVIVIGILVAIITLGYNQVQKQQRDEKRKADITALKAGLEAYFQKNGEYPSDGNQSSSSVVGETAVVLNDKTVLSDLKKISSNIPDNFGDPKKQPSVPFFAQNPTNSNHYFYVGGSTSIITDSNRGSSSSIRVFFPDNDAFIRCSTKYDFSKGTTTGYILGYYNEDTKKFIFTRSNNGTPIEWGKEDSSDARCQNFS